MGCKDTSVAEWMTAIGTVGAVGVALFGSVLRSLVKPRLLTVLDDPAGEPQDVDIHSGGNVERLHARYYHLRVRNLRRWIPAHNVQVYLLRIETPAAVGYKTTWAGDGLPLGWQHQPVRPLRPTVGESLLADFLYVVKDKGLEILTLVQPIGVERIYRKACEFLLTFQARSDEMDAPLIRLRVRWDGQWHGAPEEMKKHLVVEDA